MRSGFFSWALVLAGALSAQTQIPIPAYTNTEASLVETGGFYFQAPIPLTIVGLRVPDELSQGTQFVEVRRMTSAPPIAPATGVGGQVFVASNLPSGQIIPCSVAINAGEYVGVLGACGTPVENLSNSVNGPYSTNILGAPVTIDRFETQTNLTSGGNQPFSRVPGGMISRIEVYVAPLAGYAYSSPFGQGCYAGHSSFYELFPANTFDLSGTVGAPNVFSMVPTSRGYVVFPGTSAWTTPASGDLGLGDESVSAPMPLGFTFSYPGGSTNNVYISSNGFVYLQPDPDPAGGSDPAQLLSGTPRIAPLWVDLISPGLPGTGIYFDVDAVNQIAYVTFVGVSEYSSVSTSTFQVALHASGQVDFLYQACAVSVTGHQVLTGWSPGHGARDPGPIDISAALPISFLVLPDSTPPVLATAGRPVLGSTFNLVTSNIPSGTMAGAQIYSFTQHNPGIDLTSIGMLTCTQYVGLDVTVPFLTSGSTANVPFTVPSSLGLAGLHFYSQSATFSSGFNPLGVIVANGLDLLVEQH